MSTDWERIRTAREDLTDYVIHWTKYQIVDGQSYSPFDILKLILQSGYLKPSFAPRTPSSGGGSRPTIIGSNPAVCFTEQPLYAFINSCDAISRYQPYAVALHKWRLYKYGGRPVSYGDGNLLDSLHDDHKYLWVLYNPIPRKNFSGYPIDWTHEREWRAKTTVYHYPDLGEPPPDGVPLLLPTIDIGKENRTATAYVLVSTKQEAQELRIWLSQLAPYEGTSKWMRKYFELLPDINIVPLSEVQNRLETDPSWNRLETLPYDELESLLSPKYEDLPW